MELIRARLVVPISGPPIENGVVLVSGRRIRQIGCWRELRSQKVKTTDLGDAILMPGLINAHCHLDYTDMAGLFPHPRLFTDWLKLIMTAKGTWSRADFARSWQHGAKMLVRTGTTSVGDIEAFPELLPEAWNQTPLRVISFLEMIGLTGKREPEAIVHEMLKKSDALNHHSRCRTGLSPHAPYSTLPELLRLSAATARKHRMRHCVHVAESATEFEMFTRGRGEMFDWLRRSRRDMEDCGHRSPVQHLARHRVLRKNLVAVHVNYLGRKDASTLARKEVSVVHCPRSHTYFRHAKFPLKQLLRAGVNVCLGSDSLASVIKQRRQPVELNMFEEMRALAHNHSWLAPQVILKMATIKGAKALGVEKRVGELGAGAFADCVALPFAGKRSKVYDAILQHTGVVAASMIDGKWVFASTR